MNFSLVSLLLPGKYNSENYTAGTQMCQLQRKPIVIKTTYRHQNNEPPIVIKTMQCLDKPPIVIKTMQCLDKRN
jgi:hypothetical protein